LLGFLGCGGGWKMWFLLGVFEKLGGWCGVFCGKSVVNCVVNVVIDGRFWGQKNGTGFLTLFSFC
jgi:uncharacterized membrane protein